ncbi:MAG: 2-oxoacid:acceptor oxidoreductase subunit alpha [Proteobacteria bacterium]|nr:2-oxoacid:acceptor oxidoreductase subunit alpha [Pseudomonadota bacterium]
MTKREAHPLRTGLHFMNGNEACAEGAIAAGCRFVAGYPITPSTEVVEHLARRFPRIGGMFIQMEDEIASSICFQGAVWAGHKAMTVTSGPGLSLMMEHIGFAAMTETPSVFINVQRAGPSTGLPTAAAQGDIMQVRWGSHGDYAIIALCPSSPQECFDLTIEAFNLAERYRCPVFLMMDETVGHMMGKVRIPDAADLTVEPRRNTTRAPGNYQPYATYDGSDVPEMTRAGDGHAIHVTGLTHNEKGYPDMSFAVHDALVRRLQRKVHAHTSELFRLEADGLDDADVVVVAFGITAGIAAYAVTQARALGRRVGLLRLITLWPFDEARIRTLTANARAVIVAEMNLGQVCLQVSRAVQGRIPVHHVGNPGGPVIEPEEILAAIEGAAI